ncbi:hypothetical protein D6Z43_25245 [Pseudomonas sp. DY-1]|nr:hypothetical protein D6Z43_25245 [Pseudomonas sp. DY-1]
MGAISIAKQDEVLPRSRAGAAAPPLANEFAPTRKRTELQAQKSGCGTGPHPLPATAVSIRTGDRRCPASGR